MARYYDMGVAYNITCRLCKVSYVKRSLSAGYRPTDAWSELRDEGYLYDSKHGWTCVTCVDADPQLREYRRRGFSMRLSNARRKLIDRQRWMAGAQVHAQGGDKYLGQLEQEVAQLYRLLQKFDAKGDRGT